MKKNKSYFLYFLYFLYFISIIYIYRYTCISFFDDLKVEGIIMFVIFLLPLFILFDSLRKFLDINKKVSLTFKIIFLGIFIFTLSFPFIKLYNDIYIVDDGHYTGKAIGETLEFILYILFSLITFFIIYTKTLKLKK